MRLLLSATAFAAALLASPAAEACSCICQKNSQPENATERSEQVRKTIKAFDYVFIGEIVAIGAAVPLPVDAPEFAIPFHSVTIRPAKILKGPAADVITVMARLGDGGNCFNELSVGDEFKGLAIARAMPGAPRTGTAIATTGRSSIATVHCPLPITQNHVRAAASAD